jgi:two-component system response regulator YesN
MKILIAEDEPLIRMGIRTIIQRANKDWTVIAEAEDGYEAIKNAKQELPDILITDVKMPGMNGIELTKRFKSMWPEIAVIIISGYAEFNFASEALKQGVVEFLLKPTKPDELTAILTKVQDKLQTSRKQKQLEHNLFEEIKRLKALCTAEGSDIDQVVSSCENKNVRKVVKMAIEYIGQNYNNYLSLKNLSGVVYMNPSYFSSLFKQQTGYGFSDYLVQVRIEHAKKLLIDQPNLKSYEIANLIGYKDAKYFTQTFKKLTGYTPMEYRELKLR